ncbi:MAG: type II toxin-antitoxin system VapC family toxin [Aureliella sp.]
MPWLLDTNVWIRVLKNPGGSIESRLLSHSPAEVRLCSIVKAELWHGAMMYERADRRVAALAKLFDGFVSLPFDDSAAWHYGAIRHGLEGDGMTIGPNDLKIAAICRARGLTLVTSNTREFLRVSDLKVEDWSV